MWGLVYRKDGKTFTHKEEFKSKEEAEIFAAKNNFSDFRLLPLTYNSLKDGTIEQAK